MSTTLIQPSAPHAVRPQVSMPIGRPGSHPSTRKRAGNSAGDLIYHRGQQYGMQPLRMVVEKSQVLAGPAASANNCSSIHQLLIYRPEGPLSLILVIDCASDGDALRKAAETALQDFRVEVRRDSIDIEGQSAAL